MLAQKKEFYKAIKSIREELKNHLLLLEKEKKLEERNRLEQRTLYDLEILTEMGSCTGVENYSRHLTGRKQGQAPPYPS